MAEPVKVSAGTVRFGAVALQAVVEPVPAAMLVAAQLPEVAVAALVPAGVPALVAPDVAVPFVPAGVKETVEFVPAGVYEFMVSVGWLTVPVGVIVAFPPVVPTSPLAATVPRSILPLSAETSDQPEGQVPEIIRVIRPDGIELVEPVRIAVDDQLPAALHG
jgi:hypothetical protein